MLVGFNVFFSNLYIKSVTCVKTTPVAETIVEFYEIAHFSLKTTPFYKKLPLFIENYPPLIENFGPPPYRKLQPLISAFIEYSIFGNNRDPCMGPQVLKVLALSRGGRGKKEASFFWGGKLIEEALYNKRSAIVQWRYTSYLNIGSPHKNLI